MILEASKDWKWKSWKTNQPSLAWLTILKRCLERVRNAEAAYLSEKGLTEN